MYIVSMTSYGKRLADTAPHAIVSLFQQSVLPDGIVLWVAHEDKDNIPPILRELEEKGLEIRFCEDIKLHENLISELQKSEDDCIIIADDDVHYPQNWLEQLIALRKDNPEKISTDNVCVAKADENHNKIPLQKSIAEVAGEKQKTRYNELDFTDAEFYDENLLANIEEHLLGNVDGTNYAKNEMSHQDRAFLNGIIRKAKPKVIAEIGLSAGGSTCVILNAIRDMDNTKLYSFDYNTIWYRDNGRDNGRKTGFLVNQIVPGLVSKWELYTGGVPCKYFDKIPQEGIDVCFIDTAHHNPGEHLNILEVLPYMKKNEIVIYHDTAYHCSCGPFGSTCHVSLNTLNGKRILLKPDYSTGIPNIGAIILDENIDNMLYALFSNLSLLWTYKITADDFAEMYKHFSKHYSADLVRIYVYYYYFYINGGLNNTEIASKIAKSFCLNVKK